MPQYILKCIYCALIYPFLTYCNPIWCCKYPIPLKIQLIRILRMITNSGYLDHTRPLFKLIEILNLDDICAFVISMIKYMNKNNSQNVPTHNYCTRHRNLLRPPPPHRLCKFRQLITSGPYCLELFSSSDSRLTTINYIKKGHILNTY